MQLLMKVSRAVGCSFLASAVALQARMRCCTLLDTGVAGIASNGGVTLTGREVVFVGLDVPVASAVAAAATLCSDSAIVTTSSALGIRSLQNVAAPRGLIHRQ